MMAAFLLDVAVLWSLRLVLLWCGQWVVFGKSFCWELDLFSARKCLADCGRALRVFVRGQGRVRQGAVGEVKQGRAQGDE